MKKFIGGMDVSSLNDLFITVPVPAGERVPINRNPFLNPAIPDNRMNLLFQLGIITSFRI